MPARRRARLPKLPVPGDRQWFRRRVLAWYRRHGRTLPWRETRDPYRILVSEVMLQQTQVDRVLPKYHEWLERFPTFEALASAAEEEAVRTWYPLGYNIRPRRLHSIAREAVDKHAGRLPDDEPTLRSFKGIGAYTAGAVMSFAFGKRAAILDTNVARVLFRVFVGKGDPDAHAMEKHLWSVSRTVLPHRHVFDFNQALMDFGATVCTARKPRCGACPLVRRCKIPGVRPAGQPRGQPRGQELKIARTQRRRAGRPSRSRVGAGGQGLKIAPMVVLAAVIERDGAFLLTRRHRDAHLGGMWEFPGGKCEEGETHEACLAREILEELGAASRIGDELLSVTHAYPERTVRLHFRRCDLLDEPRPMLGQEMRWVARHELSTLEFPAADRELIDLLAP